jgi:ATP-binding cassette subfamily C (CFTR/MRP) protein 1
MVDQGVEKDMKELDPMGVATNSPIHDDPVAENPESASGDEVEKARLAEKYPESAAKATPDYGRKNSASTDLTELSSSVTDPKSKEEVKPKRSRWDRWNPLKIKPPPVPEVRGVSKEFTAGLFSLLTWNWITSLMTVRNFAITMG